MDWVGLSDGELQRAVSLAQRTAREAGAFLMRRLGAATVAYQKAPGDDVLDVDIESERLILDALRAGFPEFGALAEESGIIGSQEHYRWIVDPLDGSVNFERGAQPFAVTITLAARDVALVGVTYIPMRDELFTAVRDEGATMNGAAITVSRVADMEDAVIHIGELERVGPATVSAEQLDEIARVAHVARRTRMLGSSACDLADVACGRADALIMHGGEPWDVDAGALQVREAGGAVSQLHYDNGMTLSIYSNERLHPILRDLLRPRSG